MKHWLIVISVLLFVTGPVFAGDYYVYHSKKCKITNKKPDGTTRVMIGTTSYATEKEAKAALNAAPECQLTGLPIPKSAP